MGIINRQPNALRRGGGTVVVNGDGSVTFTLPANARKVLLNQAPDASANYGMVSLGSGPFDGVTANFFAGNANGTVLAANLATGYHGDFLNYQVGNSTILTLGYNSAQAAHVLDLHGNQLLNAVLNITSLTGTATVASSGAAVWDGILFGNSTLTLTGSVAITSVAGLGMVTLTQPTITGAGTPAVTAAQTLGIYGPPATGGTVQLNSVRTVWINSNAPTATIYNIAGSFAASLDIGAITWTLATTTTLSGQPGIVGLSVGQATINQSGGAVNAGNAYGANITIPTLGASVTANTLRGLVVAGNYTLAAAAGTSSAGLLRTGGHTVTVSTTTQLTSIPSVFGASIGQPTINQSGGAVILDSVAALNVNAAPTMGASVTTTSLNGILYGASNLTFNGAAGTAYSAINILAHTITDTTTTTITANPSVIGLNIGQITVNQSGGAVDVGNLAGAIITVPTMGASVTADTVRGLVVTGGGGVSFGANTAASTLGLLRVVGSTITLLKTTQLTALPGIFGLSVGALTINQSGGAVTVDVSASAYIAGAPSAGASVTLTSAAALWVQAGDVVLGHAALATNATAGFTWIPTMAGSPSSAPAWAPTSGAALPMVYDTTNHRLYYYRAGGWHYIGETA